MGTCLIKLYKVVLYCMSYTVWSCTKKHMHFARRKAVEAIGHRSYQACNALIDLEMYSNSCQFSWPNIETLWINALLPKYIFSILFVFGFNRLFLNWTLMYTHDVLQPWYDYKTEWRCDNTLASHCCGPMGRGFGYFMWVELLLVLSLATRVFLRALRFSSLRKNQQF
jgi:hypothetical protein